MSEHVLKLIDEIRAEIAEIEKTVRPQKLLVNQLCGRAGLEPIYRDVEDETAATVLRGIRRNAFYGKPLSACIRQYFEMRENLPVKEATIDEIFEALKEGGYDLAGATEEDQKRGVSIALGKNTQTFHRLASGDFGLVSWYPNIKRNGPPAPRRPEVAPLPPGTPEEFTMDNAPEGLK